MTSLQERASVPRPAAAAAGEHLIDLSAVASEPPAESVAQENVIVEHIAHEHIAHEHDFPEQPCEHPIDEQLQGLIDPEVIRSHR